MGMGRGEEEGKEFEAACSKFELRFAVKF